MRAPSFWLASMPPIQPRPALQRDLEADVCVVGAGFTGLWTAYELRRAAPQQRIVVLEARYAGFGASGRNGGWVIGELAVPPQAWLARADLSAARAQARAIRESVDEVGAVVEREEIACDFQKGGVLVLARGPAQLQRLRERHARRLELGLDEEAYMLDAQAARRRVAAAGVSGARFAAHCARVQPARLVRGLADAVVAAGGELYESTVVAAIEPGQALTAAGWRVRARHVVRATEAYTADLAGLRRQLLPMSSSIILTEPLPGSAWEAIGWGGGETVSDAAHVFAYLQRTADGRIAIGGRGVPYSFGSRTAREEPPAASTVRELSARLTSMFPALAGVSIEAAWSGVLGVARDWRPAVGLDRSSGLAWAGGYVGDGVAAANLAGRTLCDLILGRDSQLTRLPWVGPLARAWEPEPLRFLGARGAWAVYRAADATEARSGRPARLARAADRLLGRLI